MDKISLWYLLFIIQWFLATYHTTDSHLVVNELTSTCITIQSLFPHKVYNVPCITFISPVKCQPVHNTKNRERKRYILRRRKTTWNREEYRAQQASDTAKIIIMALYNLIRRKEFKKNVVWTGFCRKGIWNCFLIRAY